MQEHLESFPVRVELPVVWGEMDAFAHVNNIFYFRYFESARLHYFEKIGYLSLTKEKGLGPILASTRCDFRKALTFPDKILVGAKIAEMSEDRFLMHYRIVSEKLQKIAAEGDGLIVSYDYREGRKVAIPREVRQSIEKLEGRTF
jgi:acyl-CoA thioester hydrolase